MKPTKTTPPGAIYLQWSCESPEETKNEIDNDVTWCRDKIFSDALRYVLDKRHRPVKRLRRKLGRKIRRGKIIKVRKGR